MNIFDSTLCVVNTHLHPHQQNVSRRNADFKEISSRLRFVGNTRSIFDHEYPE